MVDVLINIFFNHNVFTADEVKVVAASSVELIDLFLLSTILYIVSLGLYRLFIDLKERILGVIMVLLAISFLGYVVEWHYGDYSIAALGVAIGLVLFALGYLLSAGSFNSKAAEAHKSKDENNGVDSQDKDF